MPYATTDVMGIGNYLGEIREGPDGHLYEWGEVVDGLGNPIGLGWSLKKLATGAVKFVKQAVKAPMAILSTLVPLPLKRIAGRVCNFLPKIQPVVAVVPEAARPYRMANKFCGVLRQAGIAGIDDGFMEVPALPNLSRLVPAPVRTTAKVVCGVVDKLAPIAKWIPPVRPYATGASTICNILQKTGIAGVDGLMQAPDGRLYEVVEGIGEFGERRQFLRAAPVNIIIPAYIRRRRRPGVRRPLRPAVMAPRAARPVLVPPAVRAAVPVGPPVAPAASVIPPVPFRRFR